MTEPKRPIGSLEELAAEIEGEYRKAGPDTYFKPSFVLAVLERIRTIISARPEPTELERNLREAAARQDCWARCETLLLQAADALAVERDRLERMRQSRDRSEQGKITAEANMQRVAKEMGTYDCPNEDVYERLLEWARILRGGQ